MIALLKDFIERILAIGIDSSMTFQDSVKLRILNLQVIVATSLIAVFLFYSIVTLSSDIPILFLSFIAAVLPLLLNHLKKGSLARKYWLLLFPLVIFIVTILYGTTSGIEYVYINFLAIGLMLFNNRRTRVFYILFIMVLAYTSMNIGDYIAAPLENYVKDADSTIIFVAVILGMSISITQLLNLVSYYLRELEKKNSELNNKTEVLEQYVYASSHNLKTPLRQISSFIDLLDKKLETQEDQEVSDYIDYIKDGSKSMYETIEDLMEKSEMEEV